MALRSHWKTRAFFGSDDGANERKMMTKSPLISCLFLDIGEVLLTDGWDHRARRRATKHFQLQWTETEDRHNEVFAVYEEGRLTLEEYLGRVVFFRRRSFSRAEFRRLMFAQSKAYPEMIELMAQLKIKYGLKIFVVSNEARELNAYRIRKFKLDRFVDAFISSCYVHVRKPDAEIFRLALDIAQVPPGQVVFIDNTAMFVEIAKGLGIRGIHHTDYKSTRANLASFGLRYGGEAVHEIT
jgi:putative hydrolase of the HAD superfamily